ncbi:MAG: DNA internalization-related competence protein ComEC/Rec2 [Pseudomonadota bacterium]
MRSAILGFVLGVALLQMQAALPDQMALALALIALLLLILFLMRCARWPEPFQRAQFLVFAIGGVLSGVLWASLFAQAYLADELAKADEGRDVTVVGTIDSLPSRFAQGTRFNFAVEAVLAEADGSSVNVPPKIALSWYSAFHEQELQAIGNVKAGQRWQLTVRLQRPHGNANPHGFDYEVWLLEQGVRATGYVRPDQKAQRKNHLQADFVWRFGPLVERCRGLLRERILGALPNQQYAGVIVALVVGDQRAVSQSDWQVFSRTGVSHLVSISGLHITMVAGLFAALIFKLWSRSFFTRRQLPLLLPAQKAAALAGFLIALLYVLLAGFGVPAQRTLYMVAVVALALWFDRIASVSYVLCLALGLVVLLDPWAVLWPGFWLSFGAVAVLMYTSVGRFVRPAPATALRRSHWLATLTSAAKSAAYTQYVVTLGLVPLTLLLFGQISLVSPLANAVAIPVISFAVTPLALFGSILPAPLSGWILHLAHWAMQTLASGLAWLSSFDFALWSAPLPNWWMFACAMVGTLCLLLPRGWPLRWIGVGGLLPLLLNQPAAPGAGQMWVTAFDVGQGMALLVETPTHRLLYDTGPTYSPESDGGNRVIQPYLKARGISRLDALIVSHSDNDHSGGALSVIEAVPIGWVASSLNLDSAMAQAAPHHRRCFAGQHWRWDGIEFEMLHPAATSYDNHQMKSNGLSCSVKITLGSQSILLAGDIEAAQEAELLARNPAALAATVLLAPHHGSGTSSTLAFLQAVKPQLALFQVGYRNRYRHPKAEIFERYTDLGIQRERNDLSGAITLRFGDGLLVEQYRTVHQRYWYGR